MTTQTLLSFGHGYSARALAAHLLLRGWRVIGTTRSSARAAEVRVTGAEVLLWPAEDGGAAVREALGDATHVLASAPPGDAGDPVLAAFADDLRVHAHHFQWVGYLSTTGVYGDRGGGWVDEDSECRPATRRGLARLDAEAAWGVLREEAGLPLHIFRLAGIYGPGRGPFPKVQAGTARRIVKPGQVFSRIHVDDIARTLSASIGAPEPGTVYSLCDDFAAPPEDVLSYAAALLGLPDPPTVAYNEAEMSPMARSFYAESKRVSNARIKARLGVQLIHPTYREGLASLLAAGHGA